MRGFAFREVLRSTGAQLLRGAPERRLTGVSTDTRTLAPGELFVALSGPSFDGNRFVAEAVRRGAGAVLLRCGAEAEARSIGGAAAAAVVADPRLALGDLARWYRGRLGVPVLGITGSCGKTTTKNAVMELLSGQRRVTGSPASYNNDVGVPHTLLLADEDTEVVVVEMGTSAPGEIAGLCRIASPTCAVITNVGAAHLEGLKSVEGVAREKGALAGAVPEGGFVVLNADCPWTPVLEDMTCARVVTFGIDGTGDLSASDVWFHPGGTTFALDGPAAGGRREVTSPLLGLHNVQNLLAALAACLELGASLDGCLSAVERLRDGKRRMERREVGGLTLLDDTYNANPASARASVRVLAGLHGHARRVLVLGDMRELGGRAAAEHRAIGEVAAGAGLDLLFLVGELTRETAEGALAGGMPADAVVHLGDLESAAAALPGLLRPGDVVLIKGSRASGLDRLVTRLVDGDGAEPRVAHELSG